MDENAAAWTERDPGSSSPSGGGPAALQTGYHRAMRRLLIFAPFAGFVVGCTGAEPPTADPAPVERQLEPMSQTMSQTEGPHYFFAVVSQTGVESCPDGHNTEWLDVQPTLGWTPASGEDSEALDALMDLPVLAQGSAGPAPERPPIEISPVPCPIMQMRSDWVTTPRGVRVRRTQPTAAGHFHVSSVRRLDELTIEAKGDQIAVSFTNPLPFALTGVRLKLHYEGCYGKPGSASIMSELAATLAQGETISHSFPRITERDHPGPRKGGPTAREHLAASLELQIAGSEGPADALIWTDLDVSLASVGVPFKCD